MAKVKRKRRRLTARDKSTVASHGPMSPISQENLLSLLCYDKKNAPIIRGAVDLDLFEGPYRVIAQEIYHHIDTRGRPPRDHIVDLFEDTLSKDDRKARLFRQLLQALTESRKEVDPDFVMPKLQSFINIQQLKQVTLEAAELLQTEQVHDETVRRTQEILGRAATLGQNPQGIKGSDVIIESTDWLWYPRFPAGEMTLIGGHGDMGKGQAVANLAARLSRRPKSHKTLWPDNEVIEHAGHVVWADTEDSVKKTVAARLKANKANLENITFFDDAEEFRKLDLKRFIEKHNTRMIVLNTLVSFLPGLKNPNDQVEVRKALGRLRDIIEDTSCATIGIVHLNKKTDLDALQRILGSIAFPNFSRSVILINWDKKHQGVRRWVQAKSNLSYEKANDLLFKTVNVGDNPRDQYAKVKWQVAKENVDVSSFFDRPKAKVERKPKAGQWMVDYLRKYGETKKSEVIKAGVAAGYKVSTLEQAKQRSLDIKVHREGFPGKASWYLKKRSNRG